MLIVVDSNEQATNPKVVDSLKKMFPDLTVGALSVGDIHVPLPTGLLVIERKGASDFLSSISDGRIFSQVERMAEIAEFSVVVVHGSLGYNEKDFVLVNGKETNWNGYSVRASMLAIQLSGCALVRCSDAYFPKTVSEIIAMAAKPEHRQKPNRGRSITFPPVDQRVEILSQFPGVGAKRAESLLRFVGNAGELGRLCDALDWATAFSLIKESDRAKDWGEKTLSNFRVILGLLPNEVLSVRTFDMEEIQEEEPSAEEPEPEPIGKAH